MNKFRSRHILALILILMGLVQFSCRQKKKMQKSEPVPVTDSLNGKCRLDHKNARTLIKHIKENEFTYNWIYAKARVESMVDGKSDNFDVRVKSRKDSAILILIEALTIDVAKVLITRDSVKMVNYINKTYFRGDFNYINEILNADLDYDVVQAVMFGNSAEFHDEEARLKAVTDRQNCHYILSTERKKRLRKIQQGALELKKALQTLTLNPDNYKIIRNEFIDPVTNRIFHASYFNFAAKDSVYAPKNVDIDIIAEKKASIKIEYVRIEKNSPQKLNLNIPSKYDPIQIHRREEYREK